MKRPPEPTSALVDGPPDPDDGWIHSVEEVAFKPRVNGVDVRQCPACGEEIRTKVVQHVKAIVRLRDVDRGLTIRLCSWDCWHEWASRESIHRALEK